MSIARQAAKQARKLGSKAKSIPSVPGKLMDGAIDGVARNIVSKTDRSLWNGYTGLRENGWTVAAAAGAGLAYSGYKINTQDFEMPKVMGTTEYLGAPTVMNADGVGQRSNAPTLGASGNLVLGLNASRRG